MFLRYKKIVNDLATDPVKSLLLVLAVAIGVFGIGTTLGAYAVLNREMARNYMGTHPAQATIMVDKGLDRAAVERVKTVPGIVEAERRATAEARMKIGGEWQRLLLFTVDDFSAMKVGAFTPLAGTWPPPDGTMLVEHGALEVMRAQAGSTISVKLPDGEPVGIPISGTVHDPGLAPARQEQTGYGYITPATLALLDRARGMDQMRIITAHRTPDAIEKTAGEAARALEAMGYAVHEIQIPPPERHPHSGQMNAILTLLVSFSFLLLVLSAVLVANAVSVVMVRQVREIGVMKTVGATSGMIARIYLFMIGIIAVLGTASALPPGIHAATAFVDRIAHLLNFTITDYAIPGWVYAAQVLSGMAIPLGVAAASVIRGSRITIREAITDYGVRQEDCGPGRAEIFLTDAGRWGTTLTLSFRNLFRNHARLLIALTLLASGGAMFAGALNLSKAWDIELDQLFEQRRYDLEVRFSHPIEALPIAEIIRALPGIQTVEVWSYASTSFPSGGMFPITRTYPDTGHGSFTALAAPSGTKLINLPLLQGKWLSPMSGDEVVLNHWAVARIPGVKPGDTVTLAHEGNNSQWRVAGIVENIGSAAEAYVSSAAFDRMSGAGGKANMLRVAFTSREPSIFSATVRGIEDLLYREHAPVKVITPTNILRNAVAEHMAILVSLLLAMAMLMGVVGAIGLMSTLSMNIMERTRELGVMRAVGATPGAIFRLLIAEGVTIGVVSIPIALILSLPLSIGMGRLIGNMAFRIPLPFAVSTAAIAGWIGIVLAGSVLATVYPAWKAMRIPVREALAYE
ncbi:MAG: FtsX-like permease family protein [Nitrospinae bacterium]|nr:FtsX-like permease family protein [Nitrospinota bacterium]